MLRCEGSIISGYDLDMPKKKERGFISGSAVISIIVIGLLVVLVMYTLKVIQTNGRDAQRLTDIKRLALSLDMAHDAMGSYPPVLSTTTMGSYSVVIPQDPSGVPYSYAGLGMDKCDHYHLGAVLETKSDALLNDADALPQQQCYGSKLDFSGLSAGYGVPPICDASSSAPAPNGGERCYDVEK